MSIVAAFGGVPANFTVPLTLAAVAGSMGVAAAAGVVVAGVAGCSSVVSFLLHPTRRTNPKMQAKPQCVNRVVVVMMSLYLS
jgi:hypothetical protein